jgi:N-acetylneuraminate synthase
MAMEIGGVPIGLDHRPFIIAEMSGNHDGSLDRALKIVDIAADAGAQALKLQTYTADTLTLDVDRPEFTIHNDGSLWKGRNLHSLYQEAYTPWEWHEPIMRYAADRGLVCFSSAFDPTSVEFLESLNVPAYKIASFECVDIPLIRTVASTGKPLIISTGIATLEEIDDAVAAARGAGCTDLVLLKCTSSYPASPDDAHLNNIPALRERFGCEVGLSDHTMGTAVSVASVALGATVIEKHVTLSRGDGGVDAAFSLEPDELAELCEATDIARRSLGGVQFGPTASEAGAVTRRRSLYITTDLKAGDVLTPENLRSVRPGLGLAPKHWDAVIGRALTHDAPRGTPLSWELLD